MQVALGKTPFHSLKADGKVSDATMRDEILPEAGAFYVMDRDYFDFGRLYMPTQSAAFYMTRAKKNVLLGRRYSHEVNPADFKRFFNGVPAISHTNSLLVSGSD